ncbi:MAG: Hsp20/alpha crystallin family protein [Candidatus Aenigmarchaeota archaeon]|nr:Hsp20/alpha crystallin family protein [Candidatus Aenigmarchaeota archaeon]
MEDKKKPGWIPAKASDPFWDIGAGFGRRFRNIWSAAMPDFPVDLLDEGDHFIVRSDLPGFNKEELSVEIAGRNLVIGACKKAEKEERGERYYLRERSSGEMTRSLLIPEEVVPEKAEIKFSEGMLEIKIPKVEGTGKRHKLL